MSQQVAESILVEEDGKVVLKLNGFERLRYFRVGLFRSGEHGVLKSAARVLRVVLLRLSSNTNVLEAVGRFLNCVVANKHKKPSLIVVKSRDAVFACSHDITLKDVSCRR